MFSLWPLEKVQAAIIDIEENLAAGLSSVSNPAQGGVSYTSADNAKDVLKLLYRRYYEITGDEIKASIGKPRIFAMKRLEVY